MADEFNSTSGPHSFEGASCSWARTYQLVAVYSKALSAAEVSQNYTAGAAQPVPTAVPTETPTPVVTATAIPTELPTATPPPINPPADPIVIQRVTYAIAGQPIAMRVSGDPVAGNNGLHYLYSDHLGSNSAMQAPDGTITHTRYEPFGAYRGGSGGNAIADRGYTGHKQNDSLGLIYMNARFYVPGIARFASADSIVPDPTNPQNYNRYAYVQNSPLNYTDPSGHDGMWCNDPSDEGTGCNRPIPQQVKEGNNDYGITFAADEGEAWTEAQMITALKGVAAVDRRLRSVSNSLGNIGDAFRNVMGSLTFLRSSKTQWLDSGGNTHNINYGAQTFGSRIEYYDDAFGVDPLNPKFRNNVVHELGHAFNYNTVVNSDADPYAELGQALGGALPNRADVRTGMNSYPWQQNTRSTKNENYELFADGFLNWSYSSFNNEPEGIQISNWFDAQMSLWVSPSNP